VVLLLGDGSTFFSRSSALSVGDCEGNETSDIRLNRLRSLPLVVGFAGFPVGTDCD
jgi:hypothetical protein